MGIELKRVVRTAAGAARYGVAIGTEIGGHGKDKAKPSKPRGNGSRSKGKYHKLPAGKFASGEHKDKPLLQATHSGSQLQRLKKYTPGQAHEIQKHASLLYHGERSKGNFMSATDAWEQALAHAEKHGVSKDAKAPRKPRPTKHVDPKELADLLRQTGALLRTRNIGGLNGGKPRMPSNKTLDRALGLSYKMRHVRTAAGARRFHTSIGSVIDTDVERGQGGNLRSHRDLPSFPGMHVADSMDRRRFQEVTGKALPPAWTNVHMAHDLHNSKLLAKGQDSKGRWQSVYSAAHTEGQAAIKFSRIGELMGHLDKLDHAISRDAMHNDHAAALMLIRRLGMRPGSDADTGAKVHAHGATNIRAKHVRVDENGHTHLDFIGKKGVHIKLHVEDPEIAKVVSERLKTRSGDQKLFDTNEDKTREYMKEHVPQHFLLKDLRTVHANHIALQEIEKRGVDYKPKTKAEFQRERKRVAEVVSSHLGNTPTLALASYINPTVFHNWHGSEDWS